jgi:hypothetical protein
MTTNRRAAAIEKARSNLPDLSNTKAPAQTPSAPAKDARKATFV